MLERISNNGIQQTIVNKLKKPKLLKTCIPIINKIMEKNGINLSSFGIKIKNGLTISTKKVMIEKKE